jgi:hypothetical protein
MVAVQLGMYKEAEQLYKECGRYDLLNRLYQDRGLWTDALNLAKTKDRVHLRNTYFAYAKHLEALGKVNEATEYYEVSAVGGQCALMHSLSHTPLTLTYSHTRTHSLTHTAV